MGKLKLSVDDLRVDSFAVAAEDGGEAGTVRGHAASRPFGTCAGNTCGQATCGITECDVSMCIASCPYTCKITCGVCTD